MREPVDPDVDLHVPAQRSELSWPTIAVISAGGVAGSLVRYGLGVLFPSAPGFPWTTLAINVTRMPADRRPDGGHHRDLVGARLGAALLGVGVLGGYTTFSTYIVDIGLLFDGGAPGKPWSICWSPRCWRWPPCGRGRRRPGGSDGGEDPVTGPLAALLVAAGRGGRRAAALPAPTGTSSRGTTACSRGGRSGSTSRGRRCWGSWSRCPPTARCWRWRGPGSAGPSRPIRRSATRRCGCSRKGPGPAAVANVVASIAGGLGAGVGGMLLARALTG